MLKIIPLGGLGEIGLNMMVIEYDKTIFNHRCRPHVSRRLHAGR